MKQTLAWLMTVGSVGAAVVFILVGGKEPAVTRVAATSQVGASTAATGTQDQTAAGETGQPGPDGKAVYTFAEEGAMREFVARWQQRENLLSRLQVLETYWSAEEAAPGGKDTAVRMTMLQGYWEREQGRLAQVNEALVTAYHINLAKSYTLDVRQHILIQRPDTATQPSAALSQ